VKAPRSLVWRLLLASALAYTPTLIGQVRDSGTPTGPIIVTGRVTTGDEERALPRVRVGIQGDPQGPVLTDEDGRFQIIIAGDGGGLRLAKTGFAPLFVERAALRPGTQLSVRMARGGAVTGVVVDQQGLPVPNVPVRVRRVTDGVQLPGGATQSVAETDDLGEFRVGNLPAGRYSVASAGLGGGRGGRGAIEDLLGGRDGLRALVDTLGPQARDLIDQGGFRGQGAFTQDGQRAQGANTDQTGANGGARGRGRFGANGAQGNGGTGAQGGGAQPAGTAQNAQAAGGQQNAPAAGQPNAQANGQQNGGRGGRGGRGRGGVDPTATQDLPTVEVKAGEDASITIMSESPEAALLQVVTQLQRAATTTPPAVNGIVRGRVLGYDGQPIKNAAVLLNPAGGTGTRRTAITDAEGRYEITGVAAGSYRARVSKTGLAEVEYGQKRTLDPGRVINVALNQRVGNIDVTMPKPGAVIGAVTDRWGEPMEGANLQVWQARYVDGRTTLSTVSGVRQRRSDDRGRYRLFGLLPGTYYVVASEGPEQGGFGGGRGRGGRGGPGPGAGPGGGPPDDNAVRVFYPGTLSATNATPIQIEAGQDASGVDFMVNASRAAQIRGLALSVSGQPSRGRAVLAVSQRSGEPMLPLQTARIEDDGSFEFNGLAAGDYVVQVISNPGNAAGGPGGRGGNGGPGRGAAPGGGGPGGQGGGGNGGGFAVAPNGGGAPGAGGQAAGQAAAGGGRGGGAAAGGGRQAAAGGAAGQTNGGAAGARGNATAQGGAAAGGQRGRGGQAAATRVVRAVTAPREFGMTFITVNEGDVTSIRIDTGPGVPVSGQIVLEGDSASAAPSSFGLTANAANADTSPLAGARTSRATINDDGTFQFDDLIGANRFAAARAPTGWWLKSVTINGINAAIDPVTFTRGDSALTNVTATFASGAGSIEGKVLDDRRQPTADFGVVVFSSDPERWFSQSPFLRFGSPSQDGTFSVTGLPPEEYLVAALDRIDGGPDFGDWQNPTVLAALAPTARRVKVAAGQTVSTELRMLRAAR